MYKNIFTICAWWALIEKVALRAMLNRQIEMACRGEKKVTCVRGYHVYKDIWAAAIGEELVCGRVVWKVANAIAADGRLADRNPLGLGNPLTGFR